MDPPLCKLCGTRHSPRGPHVWPAEIEAPQAPQAQAQPAPARGFDEKAWRRAYMRLYMRKRRATGKR